MSEWMDAPSGHGPHWFYNPKSNNCQLVCVVETGYTWFFGSRSEVTSKLKGNWLSVSKYPPIPCPVLPFAKQVTITAQVKQGGVDLYLDGVWVGSQPGHEAAVREVRNRFGIEPLEVLP